MSVKIWAYLGIVIALIGGMKWGYGAIYDAGWNAAVVGQKEKIQEARDAAAEEARVKWEGLVDEARSQVRTEIVIEERIREIETEIPVVVERIVEVQPECAVLPDDFIGVLNDFVAAGDGHQGDSPGASPEPD